METEITKVCTKCCEEKPLSEYPVRKERNSTPHSRCKKCFNFDANENKLKSLPSEVQARILSHRQQRSYLEQGLKQCLTCKEVNPVEDYKTQSGKIKYAHCSICRPKLDKEYFEKNPSKRAAQHETVLRNRAFIAAYTQPLKERGCADCKKYYPDAMEFDHTCPPSEKFSGIAGIESVKGSSESIENLTRILESELAKGEYVCVNCHRIRTYTRSNCARIVYMSNPLTSSLNLLMKYVYEILFQSCCMDCSENNFLVLEFDHVRGSKMANISQMIKKPKTFTLDMVKEEIAKCEIRCGNCHRIRTRARHLGKEISTQAPKSNSLKKCKCGNKKTLDARACLECSNREKTAHSLDRYGELETLIQRLKTSNFTRVGKEIGVSGNAVKKYIKNRGIDPKTLLPLQTDNDQ